MTTVTALPMTMTIERLTGVASFSTLIFWRMTAVTALSYQQLRGCHATEERMTTVSREVERMKLCHATYYRMTTVRCYR